MFELNFSVFPILLVVGFTIFAIAIISFIKGYIPVVLQKYRLDYKFRGAWWYVIELIIFLVFLLSFISFLWSRNSIAMLILIGVLLMVVYYLSNYFFKNYIAGLLIKSSGQYRMGDTITIGDNKGKISKLKLTQLEIKDADGQTVYLPYAWLYPKLKSIQKQSEKINGHSFELKVFNDKLKADMEQEIQYLVGQTPWVHPAFPTEVELKETLSDCKVFKVTVYALSKNYHEKLQNNLIRYFGEGV